MKGKLSWTVFWALVGVFIVVAGGMASAQVISGFRGDWLLWFFMACGAIFLLLGVALIVLTLREKVTGKLKKFLLLTGASSAGIVVSVLLHNAIYGLFIHFFGDDFWDRTGIEDEPVFFIMAILVCPIGFLVGVVGSMVLAIRSRRSVPLRVLVVGGGAREHTLVWKLAQSPRVTKIYVAPGNAGTAQIARNLDVSPDNIEGLANVARDKRIDLVVVGPENPLAEGIIDHFQTIGIPIFGPSQAAARIESSKAFAKELMQKYDIPCARSVTFTEYSSAKEYLEQQTPPIVIKADGLAAGKGVVVADSIPQALEALSSFMESETLGVAGDTVIVEERLSGKEMSSFAFTDGQTVVPMVSACDYKRIYDGDRGPNTGGMGSYSPPHFDTPELAKTVTETIMEPVVRAMREEGKPYRSVLYGGLMVSDEGPKVLEFNARFGDPEAQVILPRLKTDLVDIMLAVIDGNLDRIAVEWSDDACVGVVMASAGYPGSYKTGLPVTGLDNLDKDIVVFHASTRTDSESGQVLTSGGRVLTVVATGQTLAEAREKVYANISRIHFEDCYYRKDIADIR